MPLPTRWCSSRNPLSFLSIALPVCLSVCLPPVIKSQVKVLKTFKGRCRTLPDNLWRRLGPAFVMDNGQCWTICGSPSGMIPEDDCHCCFVVMLRVTAGTKLPSCQPTKLPSYGRSNQWVERLGDKLGGVPCAARALCEELAVLHHREFGKFRRLKGRH